MNIYYKYCCLGNNDTQIFVRNDIVIYVAIYYRNYYFL